jgi:hypothetical protein
MLSKKLFIVTMTLTFDLNNPPKIGLRPQTKDVVDSYEKLTGYFDLEGFHFNNVFLYARLKMVRIMWLGMAGVHTGFRTIALVLSIGSLPSFTSIM